MLWLLNDLDASRENCAGYGGDMDMPGKRHGKCKVTERVDE